MKHLTLRVRLYLLILIILIPLLVVQIVGLLNRYNDTVQSELRSSEELGYAIKANFINHLENIWALEHSIQFAVDSQVSIEEVRAYLNRLLNDQPTIRAFGWVSADLTIQVSTNSRADGQSLVDRPYLQTILDGTEKVISNLLVSRVSNELSCIVARGFWENGNLKGIAIAEVDVTQLHLIFAMQRFGSQSDFGLIDHNGMIVYQSTEADLSYDQRKIKSDSPARKALSGEIVQMTGYPSNLFGDLRIGIVLPDETIHWGVFASAAIEEVTAHLKQDVIRDIIILISVTIISLFFGLMIVKSFLKPVYALQKAANELANGNFAARTQIQGSDELAKTGEIFDRMANWIQELQASRIQFLQAAAHELRNPMAGIKGTLALIRRKLHKGMSMEYLAQMLDVVEREIDRLANLLNQILEAFKTQREEVTLDLELKPIDLIKVMKTVLLPFQTSNEQRSFTFHTDTPSAVILGDSFRLEEVFHNLLSNAVKYSPPDKDVSVRLSVEANKYIIVAIEDQGIGIPEEQIAKIFDGFYRGSNIIGQDPGGMGLGLYVCKHIIQRHSGDIWVTNNPTVGSTFLLNFHYTKRRNRDGKGANYRR